MNKKLLNGILLNLLCLIFSIQAKAQTVGDTFTINRVKYKVTAIGTPNEAAIDNYFGNVTGGNPVFNIPSSVSDASINYSVTKLDINAFFDNSLTSVTIPSSITRIEASALGNNSLTSIVIPNSVTFIGNNAFNGNSLTSVTIPNNVTSIGIGTFSNNALTSVSLSNSLTTIAPFAFSNNLLPSVTIPNSVTVIGQTAFSDNLLTSINIPNSVESIGLAAFKNNSLKNILIGSNVTSIRRDAFVGNTGLTAVTSLSTNPATLSTSTPVFDDMNNIDLTIPAGTTTAYIDAGWIGFKSVTEEASLSTHKIDVVFNQSITISPNPVLSDLTITLNTNEVLKNVSVYNITGNLVVNQSTNNSINFSHLKAGVYLLKIESKKGKVAFRKVIKK